MKRSIFIIVASLVIITSSFTVDYAQRCQQPLDNASFAILTEDLRISSAGTGRNQYRDAYGIMRNNCLTSAQIRDIASFFDSEQARLRFCMEAYDQVYDPENFYDVYDAFSTFSMAFRLHDIIHGLLQVQVADDNDYPGRDDNPRNNYPSRDQGGDSKASILTFPNLNYPDAAAYSGITGCAGPMDEEQFTNLAYRLAEEPTDDDKLNYIAERSQVDCFSMAHAMKFASLFENEIGSLAMMKSVFYNIYDMENYQATAVIFYDSYNRNDWISYAEASLAEIRKTAEILECQPSPEAMARMKGSLRNQNFPREKLDMVGLFVKDYCFSVGQIKELMNEFTFSSNKLELAKITYTGCLDPENYYQLIDMMTFPSEKDELRRHMEDNRK